jgi:peptide/nickel transport system substrate-binding protein
MVQGSKTFVRRKFRKRQQRVETFGATAEVAAERYFFRRLDRLTAVRRFVITWLLLIGLLCGTLVGQIRALDGYFQGLRPTAGGVYTEGVLGDFTNANPLYATSPVDQTVSSLIFASLFKYNDNNQLIGDLASSYDVNTTGKIYTVHLKPHLTWQDGVPLTAQDVVFTYDMIQNPDALSVLNQSWQGIKVAAIDDRTVSFTLPSVLGSFPYSMTNGIIPEHLLKNVDPSEMRSIGFNTENPVGAGPFAWQTLEVSGDSPNNRQVRIALTPFKQYNGGEPKLASFVVHAFHDSGQLTTSFKNQELTAASFDDVPAGLAQQNGVVTNNFMLSVANMVFFKESNPILADANVRKALLQSVNIQAIINSLGYPTHAVREPLLVGQLAYDPSLTQAGFDPVTAAAQLTADGWTLNPQGIRTKAGQPLHFTLYSQNLPESQMVSNQLIKDWRSIGVDASLNSENSDDLQRTISSRDYDALLYGISIGVDPDVFVYWQSTQSDPRSNGLNFSGFSSSTADIALESGRTRIDPALRVVKYKPFLQAWQQDTPAIGLYQPRYLYLTHGTVYGLTQHTLNSDTDRFSDVQNWEVRQVQATDK